MSIQTYMDRVANTLAFETAGDVVLNKRDLEIEMVSQVARAYPDVLIEGYISMLSENHIRVKWSFTPFET